MITRPRLDRETKVAMKFIVYKIKMLITDDCGHYSFINNFDSIIEEVFNIKKFARKLYECYSDRDTINVLSEFEFKDLVALCSTPKLYNSLAELISIDYRINQIRKTLKKCENKGKKKPKDLVKELDYLKDLYKEAIKVFRKKFNISSKKKSYKKRYSAINELVNRGSSFMDDEGSFTFFDSEFDDFDDDDYDDDDITSEFERFMMKHCKPSSKKKVRRSPKSQYSMNYSLDDDDDYEEDIDEDDDADEDDDESKDKIDILEDQMMVLASSVQQLVNAQTKINQSSEYVIENYKSTTPKKPVAQEQPKSNPKESVVLEGLTDMRKDINNIATAVSDVIKTQRGMMETQDGIIGFINSIAAEESSEIDEEGMDDDASTNITVNVSADASNDCAKQLKELDPSLYNQMIIDPPSVKSSIKDDDEDYASMSREELIEINNKLQSVKTLSPDDNSGDIHLEENEEPKPKVDSFLETDEASE